MARLKKAAQKTVDTAKGAPAVEPATTSKQNLSTIIKAARNHMRKDHGLSGELDRLPHLTWLMFLKFLDDLERTEEIKAKLQRRAYHPIVAEPYRWRDWAVGEKGLTGNDLLVFIREQRATLPDGGNGFGLIPYLSKLRGRAPGDRISVVGKVFQDVACNFRDGAQLHEVIAEINKIGFASRDEVHTLSYLYESMLKEMRDAAGDSGEFYTPRPIVNFLVKALDPRLGETVLDPACGTGGFLVSAFEYLKPQATTPADLETLHQRSIRGGEAKPLPYLLVQMNLLLHGMERVRVDYGDAFAKPLGEYGLADEVDVILTNPPFGGQVKDSVLSSFPPSRRTTDTALLFFQLIMARLRRASTRPGRAAVVVPNGTLSELGVAALIKRDLLTDFNLHTIVRLPAGAFAPYTDIPTNLLIFDASRATTDIWYYELPTPQDRKKYSKTNPIEEREFAQVLKWMNSPAANEHAWKVRFGELHAEAEAKAAPFKVQVETATVTAREAKARAAEAKVELANAHGAAHDRWKAELESAQEAERGALASAREAQAQWEASYWPVFNLDHKNPSAAVAPKLLSPIELADRIITQSEQIANMMREMKSLVHAGATLFVHGSKAGSVNLGRLLQRQALNVSVEPDAIYQFAGVYSFGRGMFVSGRKAGRDFAYKELTRVRVGQFCYPKLMAWEGAFSIVPPECDGMVVSPEFAVFTIDQDLVLPEVLAAYFRMPNVWTKLSGESVGTNLRRRRLSPADLLAADISLPSMEQQLHYRRMVQQFKVVDLAVGRMGSDVAVFMPSTTVKMFAPEASCTVDSENANPAALASTATSVGNDQVQGSLFDEHDEELDDALICCVIADELHKVGKRCRRFHLSKYAYIAKRIGGIPVHAQFERNAAGPWSRQLNDAAQHAAVRRGWLAVKGEDLLPGPRFPEAVAKAQVLHGNHLGKLSAIFVKLHEFGDSGLERWATILKVAEDLEAANRPVTETEIQAGIDTWPGKRRKESFSRDSVSKAVKGMVHKHWLPPTALR